ncbi:LytTR family DNA-binding domain-containing protein [Lentimicrobium sp.]|jgi:two-component system LytT family response regulator|uniref:LytR/AlgR family response regulator transcription factor n=2 Tax=Lentimicrobium sp. TaxID=2034841 RepID=UPI002CB8C0F6|nr:LytTR family DNA-binding domain-containing protein [Lentimicrobium sp.]HPF63856.1 LytTR family DNA-binding domain-containing protein [Lentimicrobium sp.]HPR26739.1 LytTR family DNA-binding domain-containing protein [Lentimicrobium sp.]
MKRMKVVIIEDEIPLRETNRKLLQSNFPQMEIVGEAGTVAESIAILKITKPDLVLMDIELADGNCFQVLQSCKPYAFRVVYITAYNHYAIKAIKFSAIDYILKPVNEYEFCNAINNAIENIREDELFIQHAHFEKQYNSLNNPEKIVLRTSDTLHIVNIEEISYCKSDNSYSTFFIRGQKPVIVSKSIKEYEELLSAYNFIRPHQSYLVNMDAIACIDKTDGGFIILNDKTEIPLSKRRKQAVLDKLDVLLK